MIQLYIECKDTELYKSLKAVQNNDVYTTAARASCTQYRDFISVKVLIKEMAHWLL